MSDERPGPHWCFLLRFVKAANFYESLLVVLLDALVLWCSGASSRKLLRLRPYICTREMAPRVSKTLLICLARVLLKRVC